MPEELETKVVSSDSPEFDEADEMAHRMWDAIAPFGALVNPTVCSTAFPLLLAHYVRSYVKDEHAGAFLDQVATNAKSIVEQMRHGGVQ